MTKQPNPRARRARLLAGALVGTVLALGINAGSTSAFEAKRISTVQVDDGDSDTPQPLSMRSGIRW